MSNLQEPLSSVMDCFISAAVMEISRILNQCTAANVVLETALNVDNNLMQETEVNIFRISLLN